MCVYLCMRVCFVGGYGFLLVPLCVYLCTHPFSSVSLNVSLNDYICPLNVAECKPGLSDSPLVGRYRDITGFVQVHYSVRVRVCVCVCVEILWRSEASWEPLRLLSHLYCIETRVCTHLLMTPEN